MTIHVRQPMGTPMGDAGDMGDSMMPKPGETEAEFMDRCVSDHLEMGHSESQANQMCSVAWTQHGTGLEAPLVRLNTTEILRKTLTSVPTPTANGFEYVLSDERVDRMGDVILADGWRLDDFKNNSVALFNHRSDFPIGKWQNVRIENKQLRGQMVLAKEGTSPRIDEIRRLVEQGILRAVSVGFQARKREAIKDDSGERITGIRFKEQELLECSLVSVPANPNAMQLARSLNLSPDTTKLVFGMPATDKNETSRGVSVSGMPAKTNRNIRQSKMSLSQRIQAEEQRLVGLRDQLTNHLNAQGENEPDDAQLTVTEELNGQIERQERSLAALKQSEQRLAATATAVMPAHGHTLAPNGNGADVTAARPFATPAKRVDPADYFYKAATIAALAKIRQEPPHVVRQLYYGDDEPVKQVSNAMLAIVQGDPQSGFIQRAAVSPASTSVSTWAVELINTVFSDFLSRLIPLSVYPALSGYGVRYTFGQAGKISIPRRDSTPTIAGSFVLEGNPIPVRKAGFSAVTLTPKKMAVITTMTREIRLHSTPAIEGILRQAINEDTAIALDTVLLDNTAASTTRPAGLLNGVTAGTTSTASTSLDKAVADIKTLVGVLVAANALRQPVWIMNPAQALALSMIVTTAGEFPFKAEVNQNRLQGYPLILSTTATAGTVILLDAADFATVTGDVPLFDVSDQAVIHEEDTTPTAIGTVGTPNVVAAPVRSLWQTDSLGIRMIMDINWTMRRSGVVASLASVTW